MEACKQPLILPFRVIRPLMLHTTHNVLPFNCRTEEDAFMEFHGFEWSPLAVGLRRLR